MTFRILESVQKFLKKYQNWKKCEVWKNLYFQNNLQNGFDGFEILDGVVGWAMKP